MSVEFDAAIRLGRFDYRAAFAADNELVVLFGHSGAGKSLTLQAIAGLVRPNPGHVIIDGQPVFDSHARIDVPPQRRNVGYVVQNLALFPHMTVAENVAFGMRGSDRQRRVSRLLAAFGLQGYESRRPASLSGGQQQRVALARALGRDSRLLLLDEPFSALDESLRASLRRELLHLKRDLGLTILFVTHDLREAHLLADRLAVFDEGRILQFGPREEVFRRPASRRVAELTGVANIFQATVTGHEGSAAVVNAAGLTLCCANGAAFTPGTTVDVAIRAERVNLLRRPVEEVEAGNALAAAIVEEFAYGSTHTLRLHPNGPGPELEVELAARPYEVLGVAGRRDFTVELPARDLHVMPALQSVGPSTSGHREEGIGVAGRGT